MTGLVKKKPPADVITSPAKIPEKQSTPLTKFDLAVRYCLENEDGHPWDHDDGEFTNNTKDPGGATKWGIIKTEYERYFGQILDIEHIRNMDRSTAIAIYKNSFWLPINGDGYTHQATATAILDTAVNKGLGGCMVILTDCLHQHFEKRYGADLLECANNLEPQAFLKSMVESELRYIAARIDRFPNMDWARHGWENRARRLLTLA